MDCAASEFLEKENIITKYLRRKWRKRNSHDQVSYLKSLVDQYLDSIEDGCDENDWDRWKLLTHEIGSRCQLVGDDYS